MSTTDPSAEKAPTSIEQGPLQDAEPKVTAAQIKENCPVVLQDLGKRIAAHYEKAGKCEQKADQHYTTIAQLLAKANGACDVGGFDAFRERFFANLRKSRVYELLAIGTGKKTVEDTRAGTRARVAKHRANTAAAPVSVTVTETRNQARSAPRKKKRDRGSQIASDQTREPAKPRSAIAPGDEALVGFSARVMDLIRVTRGKTAERFAKTSVKPGDLARLGELLTDIANLKKSTVVEPAPAVNAAVDAGAPEAPDVDLDAVAALDHVRAT